MGKEIKIGKPTKQHTGRYVEYQGARIKETLYTNKATGKNTWQVIAHRDGKQFRPILPTLRAAKEALESQGALRDRHGKTQSHLSTREVVDAKDAGALLKRSTINASLLDAVKTYIEVKAALNVAGIETDLPDVVQQHIEQHTRDKKSWTVQQVYDDLMESGRNPTDGSVPLRPTTLNGRKQYLKEFVQAHSSRKVSSITKSEVQAFLDSVLQTMTTQRHYKENLQLLFNHATCIMEDSGYQNTVAIFPRKRPKQVDPHKIASPADTRKLLHNLEKHNPRVAVGMAIACFSGIRSMEIYRPRDGLRWEWIDLDEGIIQLPASDTKIRTLREVEITDNLRQWLELYGKESGRVVPAKSRFIAAVTKAKRETKVNWPKNAARKSAGTYYAKLHGVSEAADLLGHTTGTAEFRKSYGGICKTPTAKAYFGITPKMEKPQILEFKHA